MTEARVKTDAMAGILASAKALERVGALDAEEMARIKKITARRTPEALSRTKVVSFSGEKIKSIREANNVSQAVFARLINTKVGTLQKWESGVNTPQGPALKLLNLVAARGLDVLI